MFERVPFRGNKTLGLSYRKESKDELLKLAEAGELTTKAFENSDMGQHILKETGLSAEEAGRKVNKLISEMQHLSKMKTGISSILSAYDSLIENNTKRIKLLEQMAENLYKEWFVRFRFPGHENVKMENGMPKGWGVKRMAEFCNVTDGTHDTPKPVDDGVPLITEEVLF